MARPERSSAEMWLFSCVIQESRSPKSQGGDDDHEDNLDSIAMTLHLNVRHKPSKSIILIGEFLFQPPRIKHVQLQETKLVP
jgi:hypothetical protein